MIKFLPYPLVYVKEIENWLNHMSLDGYHLVKLNSSFATFTEGNSKDIKYSIITEDEQYYQILNNDENEEPNNNQFIKDVWQLLQSNIHYNGIELSETPALCSIYKSIDNEPVSKFPLDTQYSTPLVESTKKQCNTFISLFSILSSAILQLFSSALIMSHYTYFLDHFYLRLVRIIVISIPSVFFLFKGIKLERLKKYYKGKKPYPKKPAKSHPLLTIIMVALCAFVVIYADPEKLGSPQDNAYLGDIDNLITLEVIEGEHANLLQDEFLDDYYYGYSNFAPFMPLYYDLREDTTTNEKGHTDLLLRVEYIKAYLTFPLNSASKHWGNRYRDTDDGKPQYTSTNHFYEIIYFKKLDGYNNSDSPSYSFLFRTKYELIEIAYTGNRTPEEIIKNIENHYNEVQDD